MIDVVGVVFMGKNCFAIAGREFGAVSLLLFLDYWYSPVTGNLSAVHTV